MSVTPSRQHGSGADRNKSRLKPLTARSIAVAGVAMMAASLNSLIFAILPLQLISPDWLLRFISALLASSLQLLVGIVVLLIARVFNSRDLKLAKRVNWFEKAARWWGILLLLTIPLQIYAGTTTIEKQEAFQTKSIAQMRRIIQTFKSANDESELRSYVASLPNPPTLPPRFDAPFPAIKDRVLTNLNAKLNLALNEQNQINPKRWQSFIADALRNGIQAALLGVAFLSISKYHDKAQSSSSSAKTFSTGQASNS
jgi:hypothetical protein